MNEIAVEKIRPGYSIELPNGGPHVVSRVDEYEDGTYVVVYFKHGEESYENKASAAKGSRTHSRLVERGLKPMRKGDTFPATEGSSLKAEQLRRRMERELEDRQEWLRDRQHA